MKKILLTLAIVLLMTQLRSQSFEVSVQANSGLFHYAGNGTASSSFINYAQPPFHSYPNYSFGNQNGFSYGADIQGQYVAKFGFIAGLQVGYDVLRSEAAINYIDGLGLTEANGGILGLSGISAKGTSVVNDQFINFNPYIGYRLPGKKIKIDLLIGLDLPFGVNSFEKSRETAVDGTVYETNVNYGKAGFDPRYRYGIAVSYKRFGLTASYAHGIINHDSDLLDDSPVIYNAYSELLRFGITYRIW